MGSGDPLGHPELREIERYLDALELDEAQRRLARIGDKTHLADAAAYLATRLLFLRGRIDAPGVAERLREVIRRVGYFPRAAAMLHEAETGHLERPDVLASKQPVPDTGGVPSDIPITARDVKLPATAHPPAKPQREILSDATEHRGYTPRVPTHGPVDDDEYPEIELEPAWSIDEHSIDARPSADPAPDKATKARTGSEPATRGRPRRQRTYTPIGGFNALSIKNPQRQSPPPFDPVQPAIPKAPAVPAFESNKAPPSYEPEPIPEFDALGQKSLLSTKAGRYSGTPKGPVAEDSLRARAPSRKPARSSSTPPRRSSNPPIRSGLPVEESPDGPSLFEIATFIDEGQFVKAIAAVNRVGPSASPEYTLLRARALAGAGYEEQAYDALQKLETARELEPDLRAGCARLYVELGDPSRGLEQAARALHQEPERSLIRLTFALCAVRCSRRRPDRSLLEQADRILETLRARGGPHPALVLGLKACVEIDMEGPERGLATAQRALAMDGKTIDALAAVVIAASRLGRAQDARQAYERLRELAPEEAVTVKLLTNPSEKPATDDARETQRMPSGIWPVAEIAVVSGDRQAAIELVEDMATEHVKRMSQAASQSGLTAIATVAGSFLTTAPVLRSFAPFDASLHGIYRVDAALNVLYGPARRARLKSDEAALILLLGAYLGETLRLAHGGHWEGKLTQLDVARVVGANREFKPFQVVAARLQQGKRASISEALGIALSNHGSSVWKSRVVNPVAPPAPWDPRPWPRPSEMEQLGRAMSRSVVSEYCEQYAHGPLDRSVPSLGAIDAFVDLIAPVEAVKDPEAPWIRRMAILLGAYVGEVLRATAGGQWLSSVDYAVRPDDYRVLLHHRVEATPIAAVMRRINGDTSERILQYGKNVVREAAQA